MKPSNYPFHFFGAGDATYFEWVALTIVFREEPSWDLKAKIEEGAPNFLELDWAKNTLEVGSGQFAHLGIANAYLTEDGKDPADETQWKDGRWFFASDGQVNAFNADLERWLLECHEIAPILLTHRAEDQESGGTVLSDWHAWSVQTIDAILPYFDELIATKVVSDDASTLIGIFQMLDKNETISKKYTHFCYPGEEAFEAFEKGDIAPFKKIDDADYASKVITLFQRRLGDEHRENIVKFGKDFLNWKGLVSEEEYIEINELLFPYVDDTNSDLFKQIAPYITDIDYIDETVVDTYDLLGEGQFEESIVVFKKILFLPTEASIRSGLYTNLLWVLQKDNTGLPIDKELNNLALKKCLPKGVFYPAIFFNACCVYTEMEEYEKAYEMVEKALANHHDKKSMLNEIEKEAMFKVFREQTDVIHLLKNYKKEPQINPKPRFVAESIAYTQFNVHNLYNFGAALPDTDFLLINGHVKIDGAFNEIIRPFIKKTAAAVKAIGDVSEIIETPEQKMLVIVNGNLKAASIHLDPSVQLLVIGTVDCNDMPTENIHQVEQTNFEYVPMRLENV